MQPSGNSPRGLRRLARLLRGRHERPRAGGDDAPPEHNPSVLPISDQNVEPAVVDDLPLESAAGEETANAEKSAGAGKTPKSAVEPSTPSLPILIVEGEEGPGTRVSIVISALHLAASRLRPISVLFVNVRDVAVEEAVARLSWETGIETRCSPDALTEDHPVLSGDIALYVGISHLGSESHQRAGELVIRKGSNVLMLQQRPNRDSNAVLVLMQRSTHDPMLLASDIVRLTAHR